MANNILTRFGRAHDRPALIPEILPVVGLRSVKEHSRNALIVHTMHNFEITYILNGTMEWIINDQIIVTRPHDVLVTHPNDKLAILENSFPVSDCIFLQVNPNVPGEELQFLVNELKKVYTRKISFGSDNSNPFKRLVDEHEKQDDLSKAMCQSLTIDILARLTRQMRSGENMTPGENSMFQKQIITYLENHLKQEITVGDMADKMGYSESHFRALFRKVSNLSPVQFLQHLRIETAQWLIREGRLSLTEIAFEVGFNSSQYFSNCFKKQIGLSPREYRTALNKTHTKETVHDQMTTIQVMDMHFPVKN
ncbi:MAG: AraC family transcriptional regulator [Lentisphaerales bacterium]|nr:AraC family transcriptional regulator [Lentisphaerales bacterium]